MTIQYTGTKATAEFKVPARMAEFYYNDENERDVKIAEHVIKVLRIRGYQVDDSVSGWASIRVLDRSEYDALVQEYKEIKKSAQLWVKFGF